MFMAIKNYSILRTILKKHTIIFRAHLNKSIIYLNFRQFCKINVSLFSIMLYSTIEFSLLQCEVSQALCCAK